MSRTVDSNLRAIRRGIGELPAEGYSWLDLSHILRERAPLDNDKT